MSTATLAPGPDLRGAARRNRTALAIGLAVLGALALITWLGRDSGTRSGALDPENAGGDGARAVAQVLGDHGVPVQVVRGEAAFDDADLDGRTTVVVSNPVALSPTTFAHLDQRLRSTPDAVLVVVGLTAVSAEGFGLDDGDVSSIASGDRTPAECTPAEPLLDGLSLTDDGTGLGVSGDGCFGDPGPRLLHVDHARNRWLLTTGAPLSNDGIDRDDNAAVVLRLLGQRDRVLWYVADPTDAPVGEGTDIGRLLPRWLVPGAWLLGAAAVALLLQRGRRLGPLVTEPVPVTIKALESTTSLGRLYEKARDRGHAASLLVEGTATRLTALLGLDPRSGRAELVQAAAGRTGRPVAEVAALLPTRSEVRDRVRTDSDLITLAQQLIRLEEEVRSS